MFNFFKLPTLKDVKLNPREVGNYLIKNSAMLLNSPMAKQLIPFILLGSVTYLAEATGQINILNTPCGSFTAIPVSDDPNLVINYSDLTMSLLCKLTSNGTMSALYGNTKITPMN